MTSPENPRDEVVKLDTKSGGMREGGQQKLRGIPFGKRIKQGGIQL